MNENEKANILNMIKKDIQLKYKEINEEELNHLANNLFVLCSLKIKNVPQQEIANELMKLNRAFVKSMEEKKLNIVFENLDIDTDFYTNLQDKYISILKAN